MFFSYFLVGNMAIVNIWGDKHGPFMQALHCIYFAGFLFASLIAKPFLSDKEMEQEISEATRNISVPSTGNVTYGNWTEEENPPLSTVQDSEVQIPYMIAGGLTILASICYIIMFCVDKIKTPIQAVESTRLKRNHSSLDKANKIVFASLIFCLLFSYTSTEINYSFFLAIFIVQSYNHTPQEAAITLSVYFTVFVIGRFIGIFVIKKIKPQALLAGGIILTVISNIMLYLSYSHTILIWITICIAALGMSTQYATVVSWTTEYIDLSGWAGTAILLSGATGYLLGPFLFGALFNVFGISSFMYILSSAITLEIIFFVILSVFVKLIK